MPDRDLAAQLNDTLGPDVSWRFAMVGPAAFDPAVVHVAERSAAVHPKTSSYQLAFGWKGARQAHGVTPDLASAVGAAMLWTGGIGLESFAARYPFVEFSALALAREQGDAVEFQWRKMFELVERDYDNHHDLVTLASQNAVLRELFPYLGHRFALAADAFTSDVLVTVIEIRPGWYASKRLGEGFEFEGNAAAAVAYMVDNVQAPH